MPRDKLLMYRRSHSRGLKTSDSYTGVRLPNVLSTIRYMIMCFVHFLLKLWDLNPVSLGMRRWRRLHHVNTLITLSIRPRLIDLATDFFLSDERRKRKLLFWVQSLLPWIGDQVLDFTASWQDGIVFCALMEALNPGACPRYKQLRPHHRVNNCRLGLQLAMQFLQMTQLPLSPEEMAIADDSTEVKICHLVQLLKWKYQKQGNKQAVVPVGGAEEQLPCKCHARGTGIRAGIVGRRAKFNILTEVTARLDLEIEIRGPKNEYNREKIVSVNKGAQAGYRNNEVPETGFASEEDGKSKVIEDGAGHCFRRQKTLDEDTGHVIIPSDYQCVGEGRFLVTYIPRNAGLHYISVLSGGVHIEGSPFEVKVSDWVSSWNLVPKPPVVPFDAEMTQKSSLAPTGNTDGVRRTIGHVTQMSKQLTRTKRRILRKVITANGQEILCDVMPGLIRQNSSDFMAPVEGRWREEGGNMANIETDLTKSKHEQKEVSSSDAGGFSHNKRPTNINDLQSQLFPLNNDLQIPKMDSETPEIIITEHSYCLSNVQIADGCSNINLSGTISSLVDRVTNTQNNQGQERGNNYPITRVIITDSVLSPNITPLQKANDNEDEEKKNGLIIPGNAVTSGVSSRCRSPYSRSTSPYPKICYVVDQVMEKHDLEGKTHRRQIKSMSLDKTCHISPSIYSQSNVRSETSTIPGPLHSSHSCDYNLVSGSQTTKAVSSRSNLFQSRPQESLMFTSQFLISPSEEEPSVPVIVTSCGPNIDEIRESERINDNEDRHINDRERYNDDNERYNDVCKMKAVKITSYTDSQTGKTVALPCNVISTTFPGEPLEGTCADEHENLSCQSVHFPGKFYDKEIYPIYLLESEKGRDEVTETLANPRVLWKQEKNCTTEKTNNKEDNSNRFWGYHRDVTNHFREHGYISDDCRGIMSPYFRYFSKSFDTSDLDFSRRNLSVQLDSEKEEKLLRSRSCPVLVQDFNSQNNRTACVPLTSQAFIKCLNERNDMKLIRKSKHDDANEVCNYGIMKPNGEDSNEGVEYEIVGSNIYEIAILNSSGLKMPYSNFRSGKTRTDSTRTCKWLLSKSMSLPLTHDSDDDPPREDGRYAVLGMSRTRKWNTFDGDCKYRETTCPRKETMESGHTEAEMAKDDMYEEEDEILQVIIEPKRTFINPDESSIVGDVPRDHSPLSVLTGDLSSNNIKPDYASPFKETMYIPGNDSRKRIATEYNKDYCELSPFSDTSKKSGNSDWSDFEDSKNSTNQKAAEATKSYLPKGDWSPQFVDFNYHGVMKSRRSLNTKNSARTVSKNTSVMAENNEVNIEKNADGKLTSSCDNITKDSIDNFGKGLSSERNYHEKSVDVGYLKNSFGICNEENKREISLHLPRHCCNNLNHRCVHNVDQSTTRNDDKWYIKQRRKPLYVHETAPKKNVCSRICMCICGHQQTEAKILYLHHYPCSKFHISHKNKTNICNFDVNKVCSSCANKDIDLPVDGVPYYHYMDNWSSINNGYVFDRNQQTTVSTDELEPELSCQDHIFDNNFNENFPNRIEYIFERTLTPSKYRKTKLQTESNQNGKFAKKERVSRVNFKEVIKTGNDITKDRDDNRVDVNSYFISESNWLLYSPGDKILTPSTYRRPGCGYGGSTNVSNDSMCDAHNTQHSQQSHGHQVSEPGHQGDLKNQPLKQHHYDYLNRSLQWEEQSKDSKLPQQEDNSRNIQNEIQYEINGLSRHIFGLQEQKRYISEHEHQESSVKKYPKKKKPDISGRFDLQKPQQGIQLSQSQHESLLHEYQVQLPPKNMKHKESSRDNIQDSYKHMKRTRDDIQDSYKHMISTRDDIQDSNKHMENRRDDIQDSNKHTKSTRDMIQDSYRHVKSTKDEIQDSFKLAWRRQSTVETMDSGITEDSSQCSTQSSHNDVPDNDASDNDTSVFDDNFGLNFFSGVSVN